MVISKGGQRMKAKLKSLQEPFSEGDFQVFVPPHGHNGRLAGGRLINSHHALRKSYDAFHVACKCSEVIETLIPFRAPSPEVYDILRRSYQALQSSASPQNEWILFVVQVLKSLGHGDVSQQARELLAKSPLDRCLRFVEAELERILPWRLKSEMEPIELAMS